MMECMYIGDCMNDDELASDKNDGNDVDDECGMDGMDEREDGRVEGNQVVWTGGEEREREKKQMLVE